MNIQTNIIQHNSVNFERRKIPRYIYHLTSDKNYQSILRDGFLRTTNECCINGVFAIEMDNFFKRWKYSGDWAGGFTSSLQRKLIEYVTDWSQKLVCLKIPTSALDTEKLFIRSQNRIYNPKKFQTDSKASLMLEKHICGDTPASQAKYYKAKKEAIEYIYEDDIPISLVEKCGDVDIMKLRLSENYDRKKFIRSVFTTIFEGKPECKAAELLNS